MSPPKSIQPVTFNLKIQYSSIFEYSGTRGSELAKCSICNSVFSRKNGQTNSMKSHLKTKHPAYLRSLNQSSSSEANSKNEDSSSSSTVKPSGSASALPGKRLISDFMEIQCEKDQTLEAVISRMVALDNFAVSKLTTSQDLRDCLGSRFGINNIPKSHHTIREIVLNYYKRIKAKIAEHLKLERSKGTGLSLTIHEWKSGKNRRYLNVNVVGQNDFFHNLGLVRIKGSATASKLLELIDKRLEDFGLNRHEDIVAIVSDGCSTMKKLGRDSGVIHQICQAHAIHLAITDIFYPPKKKAGQNSIPNVEEAEEETEYVVDDNGENASDTEENDMDWSFEDSENSDVVQISDEEIGPIVKKLRKLLLKFKSSGPFYDSLQDEIKKDIGKEYGIILDVPNRWESLQAMLERASVIEWPLMKTSDKLGFLENEKLTAREFLAVKQIAKALKPVSVAVKALCRRDIDLLSADAIFQFMIDELKEQNNVWGNKFLQCLKFRINSRRSKYSGVLHYLNTSVLLEVSNLSSNELDAENFFRPLPRDEIAHLIENLLTRFVSVASNDANMNLSSQVFSNSFNPNHADAEDHVMDLFDSEPRTESSICSEEISEICAEQDDEAQCAYQNEDIYWKDKLQEYLEKVSKTARKPTKISGDQLNAAIKSEMIRFESEREKGPYLQHVFALLKCIKPTSVESERAFSAAGLFVTRIRTSLGDDILNALCFLKSFFLQSKSCKQNSKNEAHAS